MIPTEPIAELAAIEPALAIRGLVKCFDRPAVDGLDLTVRKGEFYSLLGRTVPARPRRCA